MSSTVLGRNAVTVNKKYTEYFLPTVLTAMATNIAMIVDSIIAGNLLGQNSLAAINLMSPISQLYFFDYYTFRTRCVLDNFICKGQA